LALSLDLIVLDKAFRLLYSNHCSLLRYWTQWTVRRPNWRTSALLLLLIYYFIITCLPR